MAEAGVNFFPQRLDSLLLQESEIFRGFEDQMERIKTRMREIGQFIRDRGSVEADVAFSSWETEVRDLVHDMDDHVDEFVIKMDQYGSDRMALKDWFRSELQKIESRLAETVYKMTEFTDSTSIEAETEHEERTDGREKEANEGNLEQSEETEGSPTSSESSSRHFRKNYISLPYYLKSCLMYCCIFPENYQIKKGKLIRLLVAEGLVQQRAEQLLEDVAEENINELISRGMLQLSDECRGSGTKLTVSSPYRTFIRESFVTAEDNADFVIPRSARRILTSDVNKFAHSLDSHRLRSLFLFGKEEFSGGKWLDSTREKFLRVLDVEDTRIKSLPDEVGDLIHLTYLGLKGTDLNELPEGLGNLRALQTLDITWCGYLTALPPAILNLERLRHLKICKNVPVEGMELQGIGKLKSLLTLIGVHPHGSIAKELGKLTQLRRLGVRDITEGNSGELFESLMKMHSLLSLALEAQNCIDQHLLLPESFSPPPLLRKLGLEGLLAKVPNWLGSMESLTKLRLGFSHLSENPTSVLQYLPNLKHLTLWNAYDAKKIGKEFCAAGGFLKLEVLSMASHFLEEWTELEEGALPKLKSLHFHNCSRLRMLPEGLQFVTTLRHLDLLPLLDDHAERLKPDGGEENYKISHIPIVQFLPMSALNALINERFRDSSPEPATDE
ncbi:hypothetical protein Tsubulata_033201 [Turnera subulata]|uniref:Rx N-terminal domain-containing protein n=1 Tax=Turnera subulata TaxID=218843 RepID=A0A9Q0JH99_9ROSI|nr:hypothetical protein Tsubulata_033201 [Turnera subulata]